MISTPQAEATRVHPLERFVTKEAIALIVKLDPQKIKEIRCWPHVILVLGEGVSRFVSYADLPPILGVEPPTNQDFIFWRKRWQKTKKQAPEFWVEFYKQKFRQALCVGELYTWGQMVLCNQVCALSGSIAVAAKCISRCQVCALSAFGRR